MTDGPVFGALVDTVTDKKIIHPIMNNLKKLTAVCAVTLLVSSQDSQAFFGFFNRGSVAEEIDREALQEQIAERLAERGIDLEEVKAKRSERLAERRAELEALKEEFGDDKEALRAALQERRAEMRERLQAAKEDLEGRDD